MENICQPQQRVDALERQTNAFTKTLRRLENRLHDSGHTHEPLADLQTNATVRLRMSLNPPLARHEKTGGAAGLGCSGAYKACLELRNAESGPSQIMKREKQYSSAKQ